MIINNFDVISIPITPTEADSPLSIDANAVATFERATKGFKVIRRRYPKIAENISCINHPELTQSHFLNFRREFS